MEPNVPRMVAAEDCRDCVAVFDCLLSALARVHKTANRATNLKLVLIKPFDMVLSSDLFLSSDDFFGYLCVFDLYHYYDNQ